MGKQEKQDLRVAIGKRVLRLFILSCIEHGSVREVLWLASVRGVGL